jgi:hypothetical protein
MHQADCSTEFHKALETLLHFLKDVTMFTIGMTTMTMPSKKQSTLDDITLNDATFTTQQSTMHSVLLPSNDTTICCCGP